jgi:hypothetical protein
MLVFFQGKDDHQFIMTHVSSLRTKFLVHPSGGQRGAVRMTDFLELINMAAMLEIAAKHKGGRVCGRGVGAWRFFRFLSLFSV